MLPRRRKKTTNTPVIASDTTWVRAPESGVVTQRGALGRRVKKGDVLAVVTDPLGTRAEPVLAPSGGIIIGRSNLPLAHEGDALFHIARFDSVRQAEGVVEEFAETHDPGLGRAVENELIGT